MNTQQVELAVWKADRRKRWIVVDHQPIKVDHGDVSIQELSLHAVTTDLPQEPGLYVITAIVETFERPGFGDDIRVRVVGRQKITGSLAELLGGSES